MSATIPNAGADLEVELRKDIAEYRKRPDGGYDEIEFGQWLLMVNGVQWGYVAKKKGTPIKLIRRVDDATGAILRQKVMELVGDRSPVMMPPKPPQEIEDEDDDDIDDEE